MISVETTRTFVIIRTPANTYDQYLYLYLYDEIFIYHLAAEYVVDALAS